MKLRRTLYFESRIHKCETCAFLHLICPRFQPKSEEALSFKSGWTQLVKINLPVALSLFYFSSTPEPASPLEQSISVRQESKEKAGVR